MTINLNGQPVTLATLVQIATALENGFRVTIENAAKPLHGPGISALLLGQAMALSQIEERLNAIEQHPALSVPPL